MYHVLHSFGPLFKPTLMLGAIPEVEGIESWMSGQPITVPVAEPLVLEIDPDEAGEPREMYELEALVLSRRLVDALVEAGVDNLQIYSAVLQGPESGREFPHYCLVNVVGAVCCADLEQSVYTTTSTSPTINVAFDELVIDPIRARGALMFRLGESLGTIVVHEDVKRYLLDRGFSMLTFEDVGASAADGDAR